MEAGPLSVPTLAQLIERFGSAIEGDKDGCARFPLRGCIATAHRRGSRPVRERIEIVDVGMRGVGFWTQAPFELGDQILIVLNTLGIPVQIWPARVVQAHDWPSGGYRVGACFTGPQPGGELPLNSSV